MGLRIYNKFRKKTYVVFGSGTAATTHVNQFNKIGCKLLAVHNPSGRGIPGVRNTALATLSELEKLSPDFFIIASPNHCHVDQIKYTVNRDIPTLIEKPTVSDRAGLEWLKENIDEVSRLCMSAQNLRYQFNTIFLKEWLTTQNTLPDRLRVEWCRNIWDSIELWKKDSKKSGGGILLDWGTHALDLILELFPDLKFCLDSCELKYGLGHVDQHADLHLNSQNNNISATATLSWLTAETGNKPLELQLHYKNQSLTWQKSGSVTLTTPTSHHLLFKKKGNVMHKSFVEQYVECQLLTEQKINRMTQTVELLDQIISLYRYKKS